VTGRPGPRELALLGVGVMAVSLAAPLMASLAVPALAIAFWRNAMATCAIAPVVLWGRRTARRSRTTSAGPETRDILLVAAAGVCLAAHFGFWISSLDLTSVASSTALVSLQVIWVVAYDLARGARVSGRVLAGVLVATVGGVVVGGVDLSISGRALAGDALALVGSVAVAAYAVIGGRVRQRMRTASYTLGCYGTAALVLLVAAVVARQPLTGYSAESWAKLVVLTATAQLLGHSVFNHLLATVTPTVVSLALLLEIPGAALIAAAWLGQVPSMTAFAGLALILGGMAVVVLSMPTADRADLTPA
jgi:drug/metabolite transporter (DMT)-like permease